MNHTKLYCESEILYLLKEENYLTGNEIYRCLATSQTVREIEPIRATLDTLVSMDKLEVFENKDKNSKVQLLYTLK